MSELLEKLLMAVVAGLFGLVPVIVQLVSARSQSKSRSNHITRLSTELEFLNKLSELSRTHAGVLPAERAAQPLDVQPDLSNLLLDYRKVRQGPVPVRAPDTAPSFAARALLLFVPPTAAGWAIHSAFYFLVISATFAVVSDLQAPTYDPETGANEFPNLVVGLLVLLGPPLFMLRRAALRLRERAHPVAATPAAAE